MNRMRLNLEMNYLNIIKKFQIKLIKLRKMNYKVTNKAINGCIILTIIILLSLTASSETIKVTGTVTDFYNTPLNNADVRVIDAVNISCETGYCISAESTTASTDSSGNFEIYISPPDYDKTYNITITKENYKTEIRQLILNAGSGNQSIGKIKLTTYGDVEGIIIDAESRSAVEDAYVTIMDKGDKTTSNGEFLIKNVTAKTSAIIIEHDDYETHNPVYDIKTGDNFFEIEISKLMNKDYAVQAYTDYPSLIIGPGETKEFKINIENIGERDAVFSIELLETDENFKYLILNDDGDEIDKVFVKSGKIIKIYIEIKIPGNVDKGEHKFKLKVGSVDAKSSKNSKSSEITLIANVAGSTGKYGYGASSMYRGKKVAAGSEVKFEILLTNNNSDDIYTLNANAPIDWDYYITNRDGDEITEVEVIKGSNLNLYFKLIPPGDSEEGVYKPNITITSSGGNETEVMEFDVSVRQKSKLYEVEISSPYAKKGVMVGESIEYSLNIQNTGRKKENYNLVIENLPPGWDYKFKEASGNAPQISSVEVPAGGTKNIVLQVNPASEVELGEYPFTIMVSGNVNDTLNATLEVKGSHEMKLKIDTLYTQMNSGEVKELEIKVQNTGLSDLRDVELEVTKPDSSWDITVTPLKISSLEPYKTAKFTLKIDVPPDASTNDYLVKVKAKSQEVETDENIIRVMVNKSSSSGYMGFAMIAAAIIILIIIFRMFGRR